jgi:tryptophan synthase beta subunit
MTITHETTRFGAFGGIFAPETLMAPLLELELAWQRFTRTRASSASCTSCSRPTPAGRRR